MINERSKADGVAKAIAICQTSWFAITIIFRLSKVTDKYYNPFLFRFSVFLSKVSACHGMPHGIGGMPPQIFLVFYIKKKLLLGGVAAYMYVFPRT